METKPYYKRVLLKLSGEALSAGSEGILNYDFIGRVCDIVGRCVSQGVSIGIVIGAGNIWRGRQGTGMNRARADYMGMLATVINCLAVKDVFEQKGINAKVMTSIEMKQCAEVYTYEKANGYLDEGTVVIFGGGTGSPFFSTDTAAMLRGAEIGADIVLLAKNIDGVYTADPRKDKNAERIPNIDYIDILRQKLGALDFTATSFGMENNIPILLFGLDDPENIYKAVCGEKIGTIVGGIKK